MLQSQVNTSQCISLRVFNPGPGEAAEFPIGGSGLHVGPSVPSRRESPMTMTRLFFFLEAVLMQGLTGLTSATPPSWMNHRPRSCSVPLVEPHTCYARAPGKVGAHPSWMDWVPDTHICYICSSSPAYISSSLATWTELPSVAGGALLEYVVYFNLKKTQSVCFKTIQ